MTPTEFGNYLFQGGLCLGLGTYIGHVWNLVISWVD